MVTFGQKNQMRKNANSKFNTLKDNNKKKNNKNVNKDNIINYIEINQKNKYNKDKLTNIKNYYTSLKPTHQGGGRVIQPGGGFKGN
tara:strand:+ start:1740 stop:1997 length:258 start_codon:yes stop_codon:yes gene_type:complete